MKLSEFINNQSTKAGVDFAADANKVFFDALAAANIDLDMPDDLAKTIDNKFITVEAAKNNHPDIKNHYQSQALDTIDKTITATLKELGVSQDEIDALLQQEQSTFKRTPLALRKIKDLESKKANASKPDQAAIQKQIDDLHAQLRTKEDEVKTMKSSYENQQKQARMDRILDRMFSGAKTIFDTLDPEVKNDSLRVAFNKALQLGDGKIELGENGDLVLLRKDGTNFFGDGNRQLNPQQFLDGVLSRNKLLVASNPTTPGQGSATPPATAKPAAPASGNGGRNSGPSATVSNIFKEQTDQALRDLKNNGMTQPA